MSDRLPTVGVVLLAGEAAPSREALASLYSTAGMRSLSDRLADAAAGPLWDALGARVLGAVRTALEIPLATVLAEAWNRYAAFREYLEPVRYPADRISVVTLAKHTARSTFRPVVELWVGEARCGTLHIEAELAVTLESGLLTIQAGRFTELRPGKCTVQGSIRCEGAKLLDRPLRELTIPGVITFGEGIPIARAREPATAAVPA